MAIERAAAPETRRASRFPGACVVATQRVAVTGFTHSVGQMPQQVSGRGGVRAGGIAGGQDDQGETGAEHGQALADFEGEPVIDCCLGGMPVAGTAQCCRSSCDAVLPRIAGLGLLHECEGLREVAGGCVGENGDLAAIEDAPADAAVGFDVPQGLRPADVLDTALVRSSEHLQDLPALCVGNPTLDNALADHVYSLIHDNDVDTRRLESIIGALTDPSAAWESALQARPRIRTQPETPPSSSVHSRLASPESHRPIWRTVSGRSCAEQTRTPPRRSARQWRCCRARSARSSTTPFPGTH
ncbi:hypothetical protein [Kitasatospora indigofera]|uniref:hypothetical protein n=1 Tax=Kitasatospora indigofera TaxID=67307 RepID=UPI0036B94078